MSDKYHNYKRLVRSLRKSSMWGVFTSTGECVVAFKNREAAGRYKRRWYPDGHIDTVLVDMPGSFPIPRDPL